MTQPRRWLHLFLIVGTGLLAVWFWPATATIPTADNPPVTTIFQTQSQRSGLVVR